MDATQQAAYVQAQATAALIEALGMVADNMQKQALGQPPSYDKMHFDALIDQYGLGHNAVLTTFGFG